MPRKTDQVSAGDIVRLASGGPDMTVERIAQGEAGVVAHCVWFHEGAVATAVIAEAALKKVES